MTRLSGTRLRLISRLIELPLLGRLIARRAAARVAAPMQTRQELPPPMYVPRPRDR
jgi:hypothetical protein